MSKILPRERVEIERRKGRTIGRELAVVRAFVFCAACKADTCGIYEVDHLIPVELGGSDDIFNLRPLCTGCHVRKTAKDLSDIARAKRLAGETCVSPSRTPLPFGKGSKLKRKLSGKVVPR